MAKPEWGIKRICPNCGARYYDFNKEPPVCPKCSTTFDPEALLKSRRARPLPAEDTKRPVADTEDEDTEALDAGIDREAEDIDSDADAEDIETDEDIEVGEDDDEVLIEDTSDLGGDDMDEVVDMGDEEDR